MAEWLHFHYSLSHIGEGNGNPLQCSCLENPRDGGAWWASVYGVAQSQTRLKRLSSSSNEPITTIFQSILKSRDVILPTKVCLVKAMVFPVVMYGCESWTVEKVECRSIDAFELWCWRRLLRVPCTARRSNQSTLKEISPEYSLEGLMLMLKLIVWPPDVKNWLIGKDTDAGKDWRQEEKELTEDEMVGWHHQLNGHEFE